MQIQTIQKIKGILYKPGSGPGASWQEFTKPLQNQTKSKEFYIYIYMYIYIYNIIYTNRALVQELPCGKARNPHRITKSHRILYKPCSGPGASSRESTKPSQNPKKKKNSIQTVLRSRSLLAGKHETLTKLNKSKEFHTNRAPVQEPPRGKARNPHRI